MLNNALVEFSQQSTMPLTGMAHFDQPIVYGCQIHQRQEIRQHFVPVLLLDADLTALYEKNSPSDISSSGNQLADLDGSYTLLSDRTLITDVLAQVPNLHTLLREAVKPLQLAFGEKSFLQLEALASEDDITLRVVVRLPSDTSNPVDLMGAFRQNWWLENCSRSEASLVFDYEIGNGF